jgi:hypothetical protein
MLAQVGIAITPSPRGCGWGWSIDNARLTQPWVGPHPSREAAAAAALSWLMERAWRGVLCPHLHGGMPAAAEPSPGALPEPPCAGASLRVAPEAAEAPEPAVDERLLAPWERLLRDHGL